jgi:excisionase family DNA binding protein
MPNLDLVTTAEVAAHLRVHVRTVHRMIASGKLTPVVKAPGPRGAYLFARKDVERLIPKGAAA